MQYHGINIGSTITSLHPSIYYPQAVMCRKEKGVGVDWAMTLAFNGTSILMWASNKMIVLKDYYFGHPIYDFDRIWRRAFTSICIAMSARADFLHV